MMNRYLRRIEDINKLKKEFKKQKEGRVKLRIHCIILAHKGFSNCQISKILFVHPSSVKIWIKRWNKEGFLGLYDKKRSGRPKKLSKEKIEELKNDLMLSPRSFGYIPEAWDTKAILHHLEKKYKVKFHEKAIYGFLRRIGFELKVPQGVHHKKDEKKVLDYEEKIKRVKRKRKEISFIDEKVIKIYPNLKRAWFPKDEKASVKINWIPRDSCVWGTE